LKAWQGLMIFADVILGARHWLGWSVGLALLGLVVLAWSYARSAGPFAVRAGASTLKALGIVAIAACLVEPLFVGERARPGSNLFLVVADNSRSLQIADPGAGRSRGAWQQSTLGSDAGWLTRLSQDFDLRRYSFDSELRAVKDFSELSMDGTSSNLHAALGSLAERFRGQPLAGILLLTDGNATDLADAARGPGLPPVYPVVLGGEGDLVDLSVARVAVSQTNFEAAPVTLVAEVAGRNVQGREFTLRVLDAEGLEVERRTVRGEADGVPVAERFLLRPEKPGVTFYTVQASLPGEEALDTREARSGEATLANNRRLAAVDRGGGPYRVLYVSGRPNWEFKFLRRAVADDPEVNLVGLVRMARREPKFTYLGRTGERTNPLYRGFTNQDDPAAEQFDEPVLLRFGIQSPDELKGGFPKVAEDLFAFHAVILDDVEHAFFTQDQIALLEEFVSRRGGGLLMLGGRQSFANGGYARTPLAELLPVYLDRISADTSESAYRLKLTREGWLQSFVRLRSREEEELRRLAEMPPFRTVNVADGIKPGASVLAEVEAADGTLRPALVYQSYGRGRAAAQLIGDLWRWELRRPENTESDLARAWRQTVRWLVSDVPKAVEVEVVRPTKARGDELELVVRARDLEFKPQDNATVRLTVETPDHRKIELEAEAGEQAGEYRAGFAPRLPGPYRAEVVALSPDSSEIGRRETGWAVETDSDEFASLVPNRPLLERIAAQSGGEMVSADRIDAFVRGLPNRKVPVMEQWSYPLWHQWSVFLAAIVCFMGEWTLRRWKGLP
jgi:uncharacterized membrane protein